MSMNSARAKRLPLADPLDRPGFAPHHTRGGDWWYFSPFHLDVARNIWYDLGRDAQGGVAAAVHE